jgi:anti-sigma B factor antagonist
MTDNVLAFPRQLEIHHHADPHGVVLALQGEVDLGSAPAFDQALREIQETQPERIVIDLRRLDFMDCTGLGLMLRAQRCARARGYLLALRRGPAQVQRLFQLAGLLDHFTFLD